MVISHYVATTMLKINLRNSKIIRLVDESQVRKIFISSQRISHKKNFYKGEKKTTSWKRNLTDILIKKWSKFLTPETGQIRHNVPPNRLQRSPQHLALNIYPKWRAFLTVTGLPPWKMPPSHKAKSRRRKQPRMKETRVMKRGNNV